MRTSARIRLRRRLLLFSAPVLIVALVAAVKLISVVIAGNSAVSNFADRDTGALRDDVDVLSILDVVEPDKTAFTAADLAAVDGRLEDAESRFDALLSDAPQSCPLRINLELVRETLFVTGTGTPRGSTGRTPWRR